MIPRTRNSYDITNYITEDMIILSIGSFIPGLLTGISFRLTNESPSSNMIMPFLGAELKRLRVDYSTQQCLVCLVLVPYYHL